MPSCSLKYCGVRKTKKQPKLSLHLLPKNEAMRNKWISAVGKENINPNHTQVFICSLHFNEASFNRTLDIVRLRDDSVPSCFLMPQTQGSILSGLSVSTDSETSDISALPILQTNQSAADQNLIQITRQSEIPLSGTSKNIQQVSKSSVVKRSAPDKNFNVKTDEDKIREAYCRMKKICAEQRKKINRLQSKIRRQTKKIELLTMSKGATLRVMHK